MKSLRLGQGCVIGADSRTFVIAEIGVNHDGSAGRALDLVRYAKRSGADAVKLQVFNAARLMHGSAALAAYQKDRTKHKTALEMLKKFELPAEDLERIIALIRSEGMVPLATPFSVTDLDVIEKFDLPAVKIASPDLVNRPLLEAAAKTGRPLMLSTGAATMDEIDTTRGWLTELDAKFALLHCVCAYPTAPADANLRWIIELDERYDNPIGYSDHTTDPFAGALAVAAGATVVEKHLTYDRNADGPDHAASANPQEFAKYVAAIRSAEQMRGAGGKQVLDCERDVRRLSRQSVVVTRNISAGDVIAATDLTLQRPGTGVPASEFGTVVGKKSKRTLAAGTLLQWDMLSDAA